MENTTPFTFISPSARLTSGRAEPIRLSAQAPSELAARLDALRREVRPSFVAGALPFDPSLRAPALWRVDPLFDPDVSSHAAASPALVPPCRSVPPAAGYIDAVDRALARIGAGTLQKVVLARCVDMTFARPPEPMQVFAALHDRHPSAYTFAIRLDDGGSVRDGGSRMFVGASPELLVRKRGARIESNPLAGSAPRSEDPIEDRRRAARLLESDKDRHEHALVIRDVAHHLAPFCQEMQVPDAPSLSATETMWHLSTRITGTLRDPSTSSTTLALALHPTPAICGAPTALARETIAALEPFERGYFCGLVGWSDARGDGEWAIAIRCAEIGRHTTRLFAGAGIVDGSVPEHELLETAAKLRTMRRALGLDAAPGVDPVFAEAAE